MKDSYAATLREGQAVDAVFALRARELRSARTGDAYLAVELADRSGTIRGVRFRPGTDEQAVPVGTVVRVRGTVTSFRGVRRVSIEGLRPVSEYDPADLIPAGSVDIEDSLRRFGRLRAAVSDRRLAAVLDEVFDEPGFMDSFSVCPGARLHHHAYAGGLLEHTVSVGELAERAGRWYERVDAGLMLTAALLHDVGKVDELELDTAISYSDAGRMLGHVVLGERRVAAAVARLGSVVPADLGMRLSHVILSHHGELEWGAPKRPCVLEAVVLHHLDNLDAKVAGFVEAVSGASAAEERWSDVTNLFRRPLYVPRSAEDDRNPEPVEMEDHALRPA